MKRLLTIFCTLCLLLTMASPVLAEEIPEQTDNRCGEDMTWAYADGVLTITGSGAMDDFEEEAPWAAYRNEITRLVLSGSISYIGARVYEL